MTRIYYKGVPYVWFWIGTIVWFLVGLGLGMLLVEWVAPCPA